jgi:hypothetical protein
VKIRVYILSNELTQYYDARFLDLFKFKLRKRLNKKAVSSLCFETGINTRGTTQIVVYTTTFRVQQLLCTDVAITESAYLANTFRTFSSEVIGFLLIFIGIAPPPTLCKKRLIEPVFVIAFFILQKKCNTLTNLCQLFFYYKIIFFAL